MTDRQYRARRAYIKFQIALDMLEQEMKPLADEISPSLRIHLESLGSMARLFFIQAHQELFSSYVQPTVEVRNE